MSLDNWLKFLHILGATVWVGGGLMLAVLASRARSSVSDSELTGFLRTFMWVSPRVMIPAVLSVLVFGIWMVLENGSWNFGQLWVLLAIGLFVAAFLVGAVYLSRIGIQLQRMLSGGAEAADAKPLLDRWVAGYAVVLAILVIAVWDMVFKPGL
jgi:uncharacterized membrane protein